MQGEGFVPSIVQWDDDYMLRSGKVTYWDHKFELPGKHLEADQPSINNIADNMQMERYDFPGGYSRKFDGIDPGGGERPADLSEIFIDNKKTAKTAMEIIDTRYKQSYGEGICCSMTAGHKFKFTDHPGKDTNGSYLLTHVTHDINQSPDYQSESVLENPYTNKFWCIKQGQGAPIFRSKMKTPKPIVYGSQTAIVVGPDTEEIFTDKYGRVKVQFHWDRDGKYDQRSSCWLRVAQIWAGKGWGSMHIPRVGMEVVVTYLEGDPDQPLIIGAVYNAANMPPYKLPDHKTRSTIKSDSSKGGGGFNEIRFEDRKGKEQVFIHAQKNEDIRVKNECMETIGASRHLIVGGNQLEKVGGDKHLKVGGDKYEQIEGDASLIVSGDYDMRSTAANFESTVIHLKGKKIVIDAENQLTLKSGSGFITIKKDGRVTIRGMKVMINSGGAAGRAADCSTTAPKSPKAADKADAGKTIELPPAPPPPPSPQLAKLKVAANKAKKEKAMSGPELLKLLEDLNTLVQVELTKMAAKDAAVKTVKMILAAKDGLPFINDSGPPPSPDPPKTDEDYFKLAELSGKPVTAPDGTEYEAGPKGKSKSKPLTAMTDEELYELAEKTGTPITVPGGSTYESGPKMKGKSTPMTLEQIKQAKEEYKRSKEKS